MNTRRRQGDSKWYEYLLGNGYKSESSMEISRPGTSSSINSAQASSDPISWARARITSARKSPPDLSSRSSPKAALSNTSNDIEEIIRRKSFSRPLSVALSKYNPLPAISTASSGSQELSECTATPEESDDDPSPEPPEDASPDVDIHPPKLTRSRTFEVIETNLDCLPIIPTDSTEGLLHEHYLADSDCHATAAIDHDSDLDANINAYQFILTIDGMPLPEYVAHERRHGYHNGLSIMDILDGHSRPPSRSSLVTHPGTPDSLFSMGLVERVDTAEKVHKSSRSSRYTVNDNDDADGNESPYSDGYQYIKFPDDSLIALPWMQNQTIEELIARVEALEFRNQRIRLCDLGPLSDDLLRPIYDFGIDQNSTLNLLTKYVS